MQPLTGVPAGRSTLMLEILQGAILRITLVRDSISAVEVVPTLTQGGRVRLANQPSQE